MLEGTTPSVKVFKNCSLGLEIVSIILLDGCFCVSLFWRNLKKMGKLNLTAIGVWILIAIIVVGGASYLIFGVGKSAPQSSVPLVPTGNSGTGGASTTTSAGCNQNPALTYSAVDAFGTTVIGGTDQIKSNNDIPVTSLASPKVGDALVYWKSNVTYQTTPKSLTVDCGSDSIQTPAYANGTVTTKVFDQDNQVFLTNGAPAVTNVTIGANGISNLEFRYQGTAKQPSLPFGGCIAVEVPTTITSVSLSGVAIGDAVGGALFGGSVSSNTACPYLWTYTTSSTSNTYHLYAVPAGFDINGLGDLKKMTLQLMAGTSNPAGNAYVEIRPAYYYVTNKGAIVLGIEKDQNQDTTKTFAGGAVFQFGIN